MAMQNICHGGEPFWPKTKKVAENHGNILSLTDESGYNDPRLHQTYTSG